MESFYLVLYRYWIDKIRPFMIATTFDWKKTLCSSLRITFHRFLGHSPDFHCSLYGMQFDSDNRWVHFRRVVCYYEQFGIFLHHLVSNDRVFIQTAGIYSHTCTLESVCRLKIQLIISRDTWICKTKWSRVKFSALQSSAYFL